MDDPPRKRRRRGEGSIYPRRDREGTITGWVVDMPLPNGRRDRTTWRTKTEANRDYRAKLDKLRRGRLPADDRTPLADLLDDWLAALRTSNPAPATYIKYAGNVRNYLKPLLGHIAVGKLTRGHIQQMVDQLAPELAPSTLSIIHINLKAVLNEAIKDGRIDRNPAQFVVLPKGRPAEAKTFTSAQLNTFLDGAYRLDRRHYALYVLAANTGCRRGELLGLQWRDVDFRLGIVRIHQALRVGYGRREIGPLKTERSKRTLELTDATIDALRAHIVAQQVERAQAGDKWRDNDLVFPNKYGSPISPDNFRERTYYKLLDQLELPRIKLHELRHSLATLLIENGVAVEVVSRMLGHSNIGVTVDVYSHLTTRAQRPATDVLNAVFRRRDEQKA